MNPDENEAELLEDGETTYVVHHPPTIGLLTVRAFYAVQLIQLGNVEQLSLPRILPFVVGTTNPHPVDHPPAPQMHALVRAIRGNATDLPTVGGRRQNSTPERDQLLATHAESPHRRNRVGGVWWREVQRSAEKIPAVRVGGREILGFLQDGAIEMIGLVAGLVESGGNGTEIQRGVTNPPACGDGREDFLNIFSGAAVEEIRGPERSDGGDQDLGAGGLAVIEKSSADVAKGREHERTDLATGWPRSLCGHGQGTSLFLVTPDFR